MKKYKITDSNVDLIGNLIYLNNCINYQDTVIKEEQLGDFYDKFFPYTIIETIGRLINYNFDSGDKWNDFVEFFNKKYGSILENTFYETNNELRKGE